MLKMLNYQRVRVIEPNSNISYSRGVKIPQKPAKITKICGFLRYFDTPTIRNVRIWFYDSDPLVV